MKGRRFLTANLILLLLLEILLFSVAFILSGLDILAPSVMMCSMFLISTTFALLNVNTWNSIHYGLETCAIIFGGILIFIIAENFFKLFFTGKKARASPMEIRINKLKIPKYYLILLMLLNVFVIVWYYHEIKRITSALGIGSVNMFADYRKAFNALAIPSESNQVEMVNTFLSQLIKFTKGAGFICLYALVTEFVIDGRKPRKILKSNILLIVNLALSILPSLMLAGRNDLMQLIASALVYYYIIWHKYHGWNRNLSKKYVKLGITIILIGIPCFYGLLFLMGRHTTVPMFEYVSLYVGAPVAAFNDFLQNPVEEPQVFGEETLLGVHQALHRLGLPTYVKNRHLEFRHLSPVLWSNVYTFFRRPIHDFGLAGAYVFTALVAFFFAWLYYGLVRRDGNGRKSDFRIMIYGYLYYWIIYTSIDQRSISMISSSTIVTFLIMYVELKVVTGVRLKLCGSAKR